VFLILSFWSNSLSSSPSRSIETLSHFFLSLENSSDSQRCPPRAPLADEEELLLFYDIQQNPFADEPGTESTLHNAPGHYEACQKLNYCIEEELPVGVLTAPNGMGRGLVLQQLIQTLTPGTYSGVTTTIEPGINDRAFLKNLLYELGVIDIFRKDSSIHHLAKLLQQTVVEKYAKEGVRLILCFAEAQNMSFKIFSLLQWLVNIEVSHKKMITVLLAGDPDLHTKLQQKGMEFLTNRIYASVSLDPLTPAETEEYLHSKLSLAHFKQKIFSQAAAQIIFSASTGIYREINTLAHTALIRAFELKKKSIDQAIMLSCLEDDR